MNGQADLLEVIGAAGAVGRLSDLLHRRQEQGDQHPNNGDDHQQFDEGKTHSKPKPGFLHSLPLT